MIEMDSPEPPVGDGSAKTFCDMVEEAGVETQDEMIPILTLDTSAAVYEDNKFITALPYDGLRITFTSINPHPLLGTQMRDVVIDHDSYMKEIAPARTIGFTWELEAMRKMGLGKGGTLETPSFTPRPNASLSCASPTNLSVIRYSTFWETFPSSARFMRTSSPSSAAIS